MSKTKTVIPYSKKSKKVGRPSKFSPKIVKKTEKYIRKCRENDELPTIEKLALLLGISSWTTHRWRDEYDEFSNTIEQLQNLQIDMLIQGGLKGKYKASVAIFLLKHRRKKAS